MTITSLIFEKKNLHYPLLKTIVQRLANCSFDPPHGYYASPLKNLTSVGYESANIKQVNKELCSY